MFALVSPANDKDHITTVSQKVTGVEPLLTMEAVRPAVQHQQSAVSGCAWSFRRKATAHPHMFQPEPRLIVGSGPEQHLCTAVSPSDTETAILQHNLLHVTLLMLCSPSTLPRHQSRIRQPQTKHVTVPDLTASCCTRQRRHGSAPRACPKLQKKHNPLVSTALTHRFSQRKHATTDSRVVDDQPTPGQASKHQSAED